MAELTVEQAVDAIRTAAKEIDPEDFISYSTILDVHIAHVHGSFKPQEQLEFLEAVADVLKEHKQLAKNIAWDLVTVLLPFVEEATPESGSDGEKVLTVAQNLLTYAAEVGNPREVFLKVVEAISGLSFSILEGEDEEEEDELEHSDNDEFGSNIRSVIGRIVEARVQRNGLLKFHHLLLLLSTVHMRLETNFPSRFLSTSLSSILSAFTAAIQYLPASSTTTLVRSLLSFVEFLPATRQLKKVTRPPLPPRVSSGAVPKLPTNDKSDGGETLSSEELLQRRLLQSFLTHVLEVYALRCKPDIRENPDGAIGVDLKFTMRYMAKAKPNRRVPGGILDFEEKSDDRFIMQNDTLGELTALVTALGINANELLQVCLNEEEEASDDEDGEISAPSNHLDIPLSRTGALLLLARKCFDAETARTPRANTPPDFNIFPEQAKLVDTFFSNKFPQRQVVDAVLFFGYYALRKNTLGPEVPESEFVHYIDTLSLISAKYPDKLLAYGAFELCGDVLRLHPDDALRLNVIKETLEGCPLENLRCALIGLLKDLIYEACQVRQSQPSLFSEKAVLDQLQSILFPDIRDTYSKKDAIENPEVFTTFHQSLNLLYLLVKDGKITDALGVREGTFAKMVKDQYFEPLKEFLKLYIEGEDTPVIVFAIQSLVGDIDGPLNAVIVAGENK